MYLSKTEAALLPTTLAGAPRPAASARRRLWPLLGPAFVAAVAYVDPGNFATNFSGGASFGYTLLWVIVAANLMAMLIQALTAKLGMATGRDLATLCRERLPRPVTWGLWVQAEAVAIATDLAEIVGAVVLVALTARLVTRFPSARSALARVAHPGRHREPLPPEVVTPATPA